MMIENCTIGKTYLVEKKSTGEHFEMTVEDSSAFTFFWKKDPLVCFYLRWHDDQTVAWVKAGVFNLMYNIIAKIKYG